MKFKIVKGRKISISYHKYNDTFLLDMSSGFSWINQGLLSSSAQAGSHIEVAGGTSDAKSR